MITATDTGAGKTFVASGIIRACRRSGLSVGAFKPVCSGGILDEAGQTIWPDVEELAAALTGNLPEGSAPRQHEGLLDRICPQRFLAPLAPPVAAARENRTVDESLLVDGLNHWKDAEIVIVEGVGGLLCPLSQTLTVADLAQSLGFPLVIVAALRLGVINHTLLTIEAARARGLHIAGLLLNELIADDGSNASSIEQITARAEVPVLGIVPRSAPDRLRPWEPFSRIDWVGLSSASTSDSSL
jgi:dethiobiotin synthetase